MKHRIRRTLAAVTVLASSLVAGAVNAPPASASTTKLADWGDSVGFAKVLTYVAPHGNGTYAVAYPKPNGLANCNSSGVNVAQSAWGLNDISYFDPSAGLIPHRFFPGETQTFCLAVLNNLDFYSQTYAETWSTAFLQVRNSSGTVLGNYSMTNTNGNHNQISGDITVRMDSAPLNGSNEPVLAIGDYKLVVGITTTVACAASACDSEGASPGGTVGEYGPGILNVFGYLWGAHPNGNNAPELAQEQTELAKDFSLVRDFRPDWGTPASRVATWNNEHKIVAWSVKPPVWSGTCGVWSPTPAPNGTCPSGGTSPWAAADTATMTSMVQSLQNSANSGGVAFNTISISHEPHDNAINDKGWNYGTGGSSRKCGAPTDPSLPYDTHPGFPDNKHFDPCLGTTAQYKAMYTALRGARDTACNSSGGTSAPLGYPCTRVKIQYIAVPSNMTPAVQYGIVGSADYMRPNFIDYDILGGDPYNYSCFGKPQPPASGACTSSDWSSFQKTVDDPNAATDSNGVRFTLLGLARNESKPVLIDEVGSHPGCTGTQTTNGCNTSTIFSRGSWFNDMYSYLNTDYFAKRYILGFAYFHEKKSTDWRFIDTTSGNVDNRGLTEYKASFASNANYLSDNNTGGVVFHPYA